MNKEMESSGTTSSNKSFSCTQPMVYWSRATFTHTESTESSGTIMMSATTRRSSPNTVTLSAAKSEETGL